MPRPRATTAAWLLIPPLNVRTPADACIPLISSELVSLLTRTTLIPFELIFIASSALKAILPEIPPGLAGNPTPMISSLEF